MKKVLISCSIFVMFFAFSSAMAADGAALYKSCAGCHGADGKKSTAGSIPLQGQTSEALHTKLKGYADGTYGGKQKTMMVNIVKKHTDEELAALADYASKL